MKNILNVYSDWLNKNIVILNTSLPLPVVISFITAILFRMLFVFARFPDMEFAMGDYWSVIAKSLSEGKGYTGNGEFIYFRPPAYPIFLFILYKIFGFSITIGIIFQVIFEGLITLTVYYFIKQLLNSRQIAFWSSLIYAIWIPQYPRLVNLIPEYFYGLLIIISFYLIWQILKSKDSSGKFILYGIVMGIVALARPQGAYLFICMILLLVVYLRTYKLAYSVLFFVIIISPWLIYSSLESGNTNLLRKESGLALWSRNHVLENEGFFNFRYTPESLIESRTRAFNSRGLDIRDYEGLKGKNIEVYDKIGKEEFYRLVREYPFKFVALLIVKWMEYSFGINFQREHPRLDPDQYLFNGTLMILFIIGFIKSLKRIFRRENLLFLLMTVFTFFQITLHSLTMSSAKNNIPTIPILLVLVIILLSTNYLKNIDLNINSDNNKFDVK